MDEIPIHIAELNDAELRKELVKIGIKPTPLTPTTRRLYQKKLARKLGVLKLDLNQSMQEGSKCEEKKEISTENGNQNQPELSGPVTYYGVYDPSQSSDDAVVFTQKGIMLKFLKDRKTATFKLFDNELNAKLYSTKGSAIPVNTDTNDTSMNTNPVEDKEKSFKSLKQEDLNAFMRLITKGSAEECKALIWSNPKYIISSSDGPVILKPGVRYNSLHICAKENQPKICANILSTVLNPQFHLLLFSDDVNSNVAQERMEHLLDLYLNTPDKGLFETPLHIACKFGFVDVVKELVSYPICNKIARNKFNDLPFDMVCSRSKNTFNKKEIETILQDQYFVPLLRFEDNSRRPIVGSPIVLNKQFDEERTIAMNSKSPLRNHIQETIPLPDLTISALAGPMNKLQAEELHKKWATPKKTNLKNYIDIANIRRSDAEKGDEIIGRKLSSAEGVVWAEYWDFLDEFVDFSTNSGLQKLENYLSAQNNHGDMDDVLELFNKLQVSSTTERNHSNKENIFFTPVSNKTRQFTLQETALQQNCKSSLNSPLIKHKLSNGDHKAMMRGIPKPEFKMETQDSTSYREMVNSSSSEDTSLNYSPCSVQSPVFTEQKYTNFILGKLPQKVDRNVWNAIQADKIDSIIFPNVKKWHNAMGECIKNNLLCGTPVHHLRHETRSMTPQSPGVKLKKFFTQESKILFQ